MDRSSFLRLPAETHENIAQHLDNFDSTLLGLTCKRAYQLYPFCKIRADRLMSLLDPYCAAQLERLHQWLKRMDLLVLLQCWIRRVCKQDQHSGDHRNETEKPDFVICIGCNQYKARNNNWEKGDMYGDICYNGNKTWQRVHAMVITGDFCGKCHPAWTFLARTITRGGRCSTLSDPDSLGRDKEDSLYYRNETD